MSGWLAAMIVVAVVAVSTCGEGGAAAWSLLASHVLLAAGFALFSAAIPADGEAPSRRPSMAWLAFAALAAAGAVVAPYAYAAWLVLVEIIAFGTMVRLASAHRLALARLLPWAVAALASAHGGIALFQRVSGSPRPASTFLNPNHLGAWLAAAALFLAGAALSKNATWRVRAVHGAAVLAAIVGIFVTGSRGAVLGLTAGAAALVAVSWTGLSRRARRVLLSAASVIVLAAVAGVAIRFRGVDDPYRFHRKKIWAASLGAVTSSPFLGSGAGQFSTRAHNLNFPLENTPLRFERGFQTPHSDFLRAVCEFGLPAGLAALAAVALLVFEVFRRRGALTDLDRGAAAGLACLLAQAVVDDLTMRPALTMTAAVFAGLLLSRRRDRPVTRPMRTVTWGLAVLVVAALGVGEVAGYVGWSLQQHDLPRGRLDAKQLAQLRRALAWSPMHPDSWQRLSEHFMGDGRSWSLSDYAEAREAVEHARRLQPADAFYARAAARVDAAACLSVFPFQATRDRAARLYEEAGTLARTDATLPLEAAKFLVQAGDPAGARRAAQRAILLEPRAAAPRLWLAQAILRDEGQAGAAEASRLLDDVLALAPHEGEVPASPYEAVLRSVDPKLMLSIRRDLGREEALR